jgi:hypothetical protein
LNIIPGINSNTNNNNIWLGTDGFFQTTFTNNNVEDIILVVWAGDSASFVQAKPPFITYPLVAGASVTLSIADGVAGGAFSAVYPETVINDWGQIDNTWGEFSTNGADSTIDISREVNMVGSAMKIEAHTTQCVADMNTCVFECIEGNTCGAAGSYKLINCNNGINNNYSTDPVDSGGCQMGNGGEIDVTFF